MGKAIKKVVKSVVSAPFDMVKSIGRGDIQGIVDSAVRGASMGTLSLSDKGLVNPGNTVGKVVTPGVASASTTKTKSKGLVSQLRSSKGGIGGGSWVETAKNPLGGESGKTGK